MQQPALAPSAAPPVVPAELEVARQLALIQQIKDSLTMVCMNVMLLVPIAWPGLVLYSLRWRQTRRGARPSRLLWALTLLHELMCLWLFADIRPGSDMAELRLFAISYVLGTVLSIGGLLAVLGLAKAASYRPAATTAQP